MPNKITDTNNNSTAKCLLTYLQSQKLGGGSTHTFLNPLHRIDQPCSGLLLFGKTQKASSRITKLWKAKAVHKEYLCLVPTTLVQQNLLPVSSLVTSSVATPSEEDDHNNRHEDDNDNEEWYTLEGLMLKKNPGSADVASSRRYRYQHHRRGKTRREHDQHLDRVRQNKGGRSVRVLSKMDYEARDGPARPISLQWKTIENVTEYSDAEEEDPTDATDTTTPRTSDTKTSRNTAVASAASATTTPVPVPPTRTIIDDKQRRIRIRHNTTNNGSASCSSFVSSLSSLLTSRRIALVASPHYTLILVRTQEGARHMIRALLSQVGRCPIVGDVRYNWTPALVSPSSSLVLENKKEDDHRRGRHNRNKANTTTTAPVLRDRSVALHAYGIHFNPKQLQLGSLDTYSFRAPIPSTWR